MIVELISTMGTGLICSALYDTVKFVIDKLIDKNEDKKGKKELIENITKELYSNVPEECKKVLDSGTFVEYLNSYRFLDLFNTYLEQKVMTNYASKNAKLRKIINSRGIITIDTVLKHITDKLVDLYDQNKVLTPPSRNDIYKTLDHIIQVSERVIMSTVSPDNSRMLYLINARMDEIGARIIDQIIILQESFQIIEKKLFSTKFSVEDFEKTRKQYYEILKEKNAEAHIYLLDKFPFNSFYVPPVLGKSRKNFMGMPLHVARRRGLRVTWDNIFSDSNIVYVVGGAGYGKSLFEKKIINDYKNLNIFRADEYIVLYGELKSFYPNNVDSPISVIDFLKNSVRSNTLIDVSDEFIQHYLDAGRCIILLDALDEVDKNKRDSLHETVASFFKKQNPNNKICITSRERGFLPEKNIEVFNIYPLVREQIEEYVDKIIALGRFESTDKAAFIEQTEELIEKGFLNSFLVLSLLVNIYKAERELPENKLELYQKCFDYIANKREKEKTGEEFDWSQIIPLMKDSTFIELSQMCLPNNTSVDKAHIKEKLLEVYKNKFSSEAELENALEEFLKFSSERTELFVPSEEERFKFFHRSFFEYFYAKYITKRFHSAVERLNELTKFDIDSEIFELTVAMLKQDYEQDYQALINLMFDKVEEEFKNSLSDFQIFNILILSMQVIDDALYRDKFVQLIEVNKRIILSNYEKVQNLRLFGEIFKNSKEHSLRIAKAYEDESVLCLLKNCVEFFDLIDNSEDINIDEFLERDLSNLDMLSLRRRKLFDRKDLWYAFYMREFVKVIDCHELLTNIDIERILEVHKKFRPNNYRKPSQKAEEAVNRYRDLLGKKQSNALKIITTYFGIIGHVIYIA